MNLARDRSATALNDPAPRSVDYLLGASFGVRVLQQQDSTATTKARRKKRRETKVFSETIASRYVSRDPAAIFDSRNTDDVDCAYARRKLGPPCELGLRGIPRNRWREERESPSPTETSRLPRDGSSGKLEDLNCRVEGARGLSAKTLRGSAERTRRI